MSIPDQDQYVFEVTRGLPTISVSSSSHACVPGDVDSNEWTHLGPGAAAAHAFAMGGPLQYVSLLDFAEDEQGGCACCAMRTHNYHKQQRAAALLAPPPQLPSAISHRSIIDQVLRNVPTGTSADSFDSDSDDSDAGQESDDDVSEAHQSSSASSPSKFPEYFQLIFLPLPNLPSSSSSSSNSSSLQSIHEADSILAVCPFTQLSAEGDTLIDAIEAWQSRAESHYRCLDAFGFPNTFMRAATNTKSPSELPRMSVSLVPTATDSSEQMILTLSSPVPFSHALLSRQSSSVQVDSFSSLEAALNSFSLSSSPSSPLLPIELVCSPLMKFTADRAAVSVDQSP